MSTVQMQTKEVMFLRYGMEEPSISNPPTPLLTLQYVAKLMKTSLGRVAYLDRLYFKQIKPARLSLFVPKYRAKPDKRSGVTQANLTTEEFEYLTSDEN
jgi:hypothetical protein